MNLGGALAGLVGSGGPGGYFSPEQQQQRQAQQQQALLLKLLSSGGQPAGQAPAAPPQPQYTGSTPQSPYGGLNSPQGGPVPITGMGVTPPAMPQRPTQAPPVMPQPQQSPAGTDQQPINPFAQQQSFMRGLPDLQTVIQRASMMPGSDADKMAAIQEYIKIAVPMMTADSRQAYQMGMLQGNLMRAGAAQENADSNKTRSRASVINANANASRSAKAPDKSSEPPPETPLHRELQKNLDKATASYLKAKNPKSGATPDDVAFFKKKMDTLQKQIDNLDASTGNVAPAPKDDPLGLFQ